MAPATPSQPRLDEARREIDRIDDALADLLAERMAVIDQVMAAKGPQALASGLAIRPGREARILDRVATRLSGRFPALAAVAIWRQIMAASTLKQSALEVHLSAGGGHDAMAAARFHFGALVPVSVHESASKALAIASTKPSGVAMLPFAAGESEGNEEAWWAGLSGDARLKVIARLPVIVHDEAPKGDYAVLAAATPEPSGGDVTLMVAAGMDEAAACAQLAEARLDGDIIARSGKALLIAAAGLVAPGDVSAGALTVIGGYPKPLSGLEGAGT